MSDLWMLRSDYAELAKTFNAAGASISTAFLCTRLWTRTTQLKGLWWDDLFLLAAWALQLLGNGLSASAPTYGYNVYSAATAPRGWALVYGSLSAWYIASALAKTAFATTLLRLTAGGAVKLVLWLVLAVAWAFAAAVAATAWLDLCDERVAVSIKATCVTRTTYLWIHVGNSVSTVGIDLLLAYLPWRIVSMVHLPNKEKWAVSLSMSLTGLSGVLCVVRIVQLTKLVELEKKQLDFTYGAFACHAFLQFEIVLYIVAQTVPLLRVLIVGSKTSSKAGGTTNISIAELSRSGPQTKQAKAMPDLDALAGDHASLELVQLPGGRVVAADSEEGQRHCASQGEREAAGTVASRSVAAAEAQGHEPRDVDEPLSVDDEVHRLWADMGLSRRAWSQSPSPPQAATQHRRQPSDLVGMTPA